MFTPEECTANSLTEADISDLFYRELRNLCGLRHKNIINVLAACVEPQNLCIVMELCRIGDLRSILSSKRDVTSSNRINWAVGIARGLLYMHASQPQLIHRDVKASNVLIDGKSDTAKIIDFGLCTMKGETDWSFTSHGLNERTTRGTPAYMAPGTQCRRPRSIKLFHSYFRWQSNGGMKMYRTAQMFMRLVSFYGRSGRREFLGRTSSLTPFKPKSPLGIVCRFLMLKCHLQ
jgi:serine/threonine protein kinase